MDITQPDSQLDEHESPEESQPKRITIARKFGSVSKWAKENSEKRSRNPSRSPSSPSTDQENHQ